MLLYHKTTFWCVDPPDADGWVASLIEHLQSKNYLDIEIDETTIETDEVSKITITFWFKKIV